MKYDFSVKAKAAIEAYEELGSVAELKEKLALLEKYEALGSSYDLVKWNLGAYGSNLNRFGNVIELESKEDLLEEYGIIGTPDEINECFDILEEYMNLGSVEEVKVCVAKLVEADTDSKLIAHIEDVKARASNLTANNSKVVDDYGSVIIHLDEEATSGFERNEAPVFKSLSLDTSIARPSVTGIDVVPPGLRDTDEEVVEGFGVVPCR